MSIIQQHQIRFCAGCSARNCNFCPANTPLAVAIRERRSELHLTLNEVETLSGIPTLRWLALESGGWIPDQRSDMRAIADTLQGNVSVVSMLAFLSHYAA